MACKNCKDKTSKYLKQLNKMGADVNFDSDTRKEQFSTWEKSMGKIKRWERIVVILFAWIPIMVGYFTIIQFIISLF